MKTVPFKTSVNKESSHIKIVANIKVGTSRVVRTVPVMKVITSRIISGMKATPGKAPPPRSR